MIKIIDILNKMADGTLEDGFEFRYKNKIYKYKKEIDAIIDSRKMELGYGIDLGQEYIVEQILNDEVEVIEETKDIEELDMCNFGHNNTISKQEADIINKINELVRAVNKLNKEREEK